MKKLILNLKEVALVFLSLVSFGFVIASSLWILSESTIPALILAGSATLLYLLRHWLKTL